MNHARPHTTRTTIVATIVLAVLSVALLMDRRQLPHLHTVLDTSSLVVCGVLAMYFWDVGRRADRGLPMYLATSFALTSLAEMVHVLVAIEWGGSLAFITEDAVQLRPATFPLAMHLLPIGIIAALHFAERPVSQRVFAGILAGAGTLLGWAFMVVPRYVPGGYVSRPFLLAAPVLWAYAAWACVRARRADRSLPSMAIMAALVSAGMISMLFSLSSDDSQAMVAHLAKVTGYVGLLLWLTQVSSDDLVGRERAEAQLVELNRELGERVQDRTRQFRSLVEASPVGHVLVDSNGLIVLVNREVERQFGYLRSELINAKIEVLVPKRALGTHERSRTEFFEKPSARRMGVGRDLFGVRKDGTEVPVEIALSPIESGDETLVMASIIDITERKRAEAAVTEGEAYYRAILENISDAVIITSPEGMILDVNPRVTELLGWSRRDLLKMHARETYPERSMHEQPQRQRNATEGHVQYERTMMRKDGTEFVAEISARMMPDGRYLGSIRDVSQRRKEIDELAESEARFRQIAENIREAFFLLDLAAGKTIYVSPVWGEIWGRSVSVAYAHSRAWMEDVHPDDKPRLVTFQDLIRAGQYATDTFRVVRPDGSIRWVRGRAFPIKNAEGRVYRLAGVVEDITDLRRAEEQMTQAQKMEAVGRLAGGVAHDFNNLLTVILSEAELARAEPDVSGSLREALAAIKNAGDSAAVLTRQLLMFSRRQLVTPEVFNLNDVVNDIQKMLRRLIGEDIVVTARLAPDQCSVRADRGQIEQVLMNLAVNARDAMPAGGSLFIETQVKRFEYEPERGLPAGAYVVMSVSDSGHGMPDSVKEHMFEPFFTTKEAGKGTGLGLATSYGIVKQAGGEIAAYSELDVGTTMKVYLPLVAARAEASDVRAVAVTPTGAETILLVEDEPALRHIGVRLLGGLGYTVLAAKDGESALDIARNHAGDIDMLLTDVVLPGIGGRDLAEQIGRVRKGIRILFMSGYTDDVILRNQLVERDVQLVQKPFTRSSLARTVRNVLDAVK